ncbi:MAG TPA: PAS domain S-box protein [Candidatus Sulfopaludibacter sp.]|nr:PAS domain S-box protein [Candidatus Sulfopaludibacter sp.]
MQFGHPHYPDRVYRIGWGNSPPFQVRRPDGTPTGLAVDLIRTAAQRRGIRLQWVYWNNSSDSALLNGKTDLWPIIAITPDRLKVFHISQPFLDAEYCLLVRPESPYTKWQDLAHAPIGTTSSNIDTWHLRNHLPDAPRVVQPVRRLVMDDLCQGRSEAAFMDSFTAVATLLEKRDSCANQVLRWIGAPEIRSQFGIGATFAAAPVADALRDEMAAISAEGKLASILGQWGYMSQQLESIEVLIDARRRARQLAGAAVLFAVLFVIAMWQTIRILRERDRTHQAETALRDTEQKLRLMANNMKEMVLAYDMDRHLLFANPAVETLTGYPIAELSKADFVNWIHPEDQARMLPYWDSLFQGASYQDEEYRLITRDGRVKWASATWGPILDPAGTQIGVQGSERDITERKLADEALRVSEHRFRGLLEHVQLVAAIFDISGNYVFVNDYALEVLGWTRDHVIGHHCTEFITEDLRASTLSLIQTLQQTGEPAHWLAEVPLIASNGKVRLLQVNNVTLRDASGKLAGVASLGADLTEHRALQAQLLQSQKLESLGTLAGGVAHDFNNLLTVINGYSDLVLNALSTDDSVRPKINQIRSAGERAAELTQQLLAFSRRQIAKPRPFNLNRMLQDSGVMFRALLGEEIELVERLGDSLGQVVADPGQMHQVLMNLLTNARDAMPGGGKLIVETGNIVSRRPELPPGHYVRLAVTDHGVGMNEETRSRIFEPFFTTKGPGKGTGLGLSTVYGIVKQSGGWIFVRTAPGQGTTFEILLPRVDTAADVPSLDESEASQSHGETILVVEDQPQVLAMVTAMLESLEYRVLSACDGPAAIAIAETYPAPIHVLLTDVVLPGINGKQTAERIQALRPQISVVFTSGYSQDVIAHRGVLDSHVSYLAKPYSLHDLAGILRKSLT